MSEVIAEKPGKSRRRRLLYLIVGMTFAYALGSLVTLTATYRTVDSASRYIAGLAIIVAEFFMLFAFVLVWRRLTD